jgi:pimeloyl-ACP methyl ester carboxylesterase
MLGDKDSLTVRLGDGRVLEVLTAGPVDGMPLVFHIGTPAGAALYPPLVDAARSRGLRMVHYSRPGYGLSTALAGRSVADAARDVAAVLDAIGADRFATIGFSGGGPYGLACAALLPDRCLAAASIAGLAPYGVDDLDWFAGMEEGNREGYSLAIAGGAGLTLRLEKEAPEIAAMLTQPLDAAALSDPAAADIAAFREFLAASFQRVLQGGIQGWRDDELAFVHPWGFDPTAITCPVAVWHGEKDQAVPPQHGHWLAAHIPNARAHFDPEGGHGVLFRVHLREIVDELAALAQAHSG